MKKLFILLSVLISIAAIPTHANCQNIKFFGIVVNGGTGGGGGGGGTPTEFVKLNFVNEFGCTAPTGWNYICGTNTAIQTANGVTFNNLKKQDNSTTTLSFTNSTAWVSNYTGFSPADVGDPANSGVFLDEVVKYGWKFNSGNQFTIGGLTVGTTYTFYFLSNAASFESSTVSFTIGSTTSATKANSNNWGSSATSPFYSDASMVSVAFTATSSSVVVTCNIVSGASSAPLSALIIAK
jgi:hypothetical protein